MEMYSRLAVWTTSTAKKRVGDSQKNYVGWFLNVFIFHFLSFFLLNKLPGSKGSLGEGEGEAVGVRGFSDTWRPCR